jgi:hypothetical protein
VWFVKTITGFSFDAIKSGVLEVYPYKPFDP